MLVAYSLGYNSQSWTPGELVEELHTNLLVESFPRHLASLSYIVDNTCPTRSPNSMSRFPTSLKVLRFQQHLAIEWGHIRYSLDHLKKLRYLVIVDPFLTQSEAKSIIRFAIKQNLRMLCLMTGPLKSTSFPPISWHARI